MNELSGITCAVLAGEPDDDSRLRTPTPLPTQLRSQNRTRPKAIGTMAAEASAAIERAFSSNRIESNGIKWNRASWANTERLSMDAIAI